MVNTARAIRLLCHVLGHRTPADHDPDERWAVCSRCGEVFDAAAEDDIRADGQAW